MKSNVIYPDVEDYEDEEFVIEQDEEYRGEI